MICILNVGSGNLKSVKNALDFLRIKNIISNDKKIINSSKYLIIPGDGAFGHAMNYIKRKKLDIEIEKFIKNGKPVLGICLGFQILMKSSNEFSLNDGLSIFNHKVLNLDFKSRTHIGFNKIYCKKKMKLLKNIKNKTFYFLHSYGVKSLKLPNYFNIGLTKYENKNFISIIEYKNIYATQFHPEKSGEQGLKLLKNFVEYCK